MLNFQPPNLTCPIIKNDKKPSGIGLGPLNPKQKQKLNKFYHFYLATIFVNYFTMNSADCPIGCWKYDVIRFYFLEKF